MRKMHCHDAGSRAVAAQAGSPLELRDIAAEAGEPEMRSGN